jgi:hypothetical protein
MPRSLYRIESLIFAAALLRTGTAAAEDRVAVGIEIRIDCPALDEEAKNALEARARADLDPLAVQADPTRARTELGWAPRAGLDLFLEDMLEA